MRPGSFPPLSNLLREKIRGGMSHTYLSKPSSWRLSYPPQQRSARETAHLAKWRTPIQVHFSPSSNILLVLHCRKPQEGRLISLLKMGADFQAQGMAVTPSARHGIGVGGRNPKTKQCRKGRDIVNIKGI